MPSLMELKQLLRVALVEKSRSVASVYTDAAIINARQVIDTVMFWSGALRTHTIDEHIVIDEIEIATDVLTTAAEKVLLANERIVTQIIAHKIS